MSRILLILSIVAIFIVIAITLITIEAREDSDSPKNNTQKSIDPLLSAKGDTTMGREKELIIFDFSKASDLNQWRTINDTVMGGISESQLQLTKEGYALFTGNVSLENYGGFASLQSQTSKYDFTGYEGIAIRLKGDGKRYKFSLKTNAYLDTTRYEAAFNTDKGTWTTVSIPFSTLVPTFRGTLLNNEPSLDTSKVKSFGLLIANKQEGPFRLEIDWIKVY